MKIIVVGCGKIGSTILSNLISEGHNVVAVDNNPEIITEINNNPQGWETESYPGDSKRIVFMRMKDIYGRPCIRFIGVFRYKQGDSKQCTHERVATQVKISDLLPNNK